MRYGGLAAALASAVATTVCVAPAHADDRAEKEARALFKEGNKALEEGNYVDALDMYRGAYARWPNPKILLNMGTALRALGRFAEAADTYERYLNDSGADKKKRPEVEKILVELAAKVGKIHVEVNEPGARVLVDGKEVGQSPQAIILRVDPGTHAVVAEKEGYALSAATVSVAAGEERVVQLRLLPPAGGTPTPPRPTDPDGVDVAAADPPVDPEPDSGVEPAGDGVIRRRAEPRSRGGLGLFARMDVDPVNSGGVGIVGATYGLGGSFELAAAALIGMPAKGGWVGARLFLGSSSFRPTITAGVPIVSNDGVHVGVHGAVGLQLDLSPKFGLFLDAGAVFFPDQDVNGFIFTPSVGAQLKL